MATLSIIVPVYNSENYLENTVQSVLQQNYTDYELILVNDGSKDNSWQLCQRLAAKDVRIRIFDKINGGVSSARNYGLEQANGKYIAFLDADDCVDREMYESLIALLEKIGADLTGCSVVKEAEYHPLTYKEEAFFSSDKPLELLTNKADFIDSSLNKVYRREIIGDTRFDENIAYSEDKLFVAEIFLKAKRVALLPNKFYHYIQHGDSLSWQDTYDVWDGNYQVHRRIYEKFQKLHVDSEIQASAFRGYVMAIIALLRYDVKYRRQDLYEKTLAEHQQDIQIFMEHTKMPLGKRMEYLTYTTSWSLASLVHYHLKRRK